MEKEQKNETLLELFNTGLEKWTALENDLRPAETLVRSTIETFERCSELVEKNSLFSSNETLDDITSASLTYLTIPYYLSELYQKIPISAPAERRPILALSRRLLEQYLGTCVNYEILSKSDIAIYEREVDPDPGTLRNEKIARIRQTKAIDEQIKKNLQEKIAKGLLDDDQECELDRENQILFVRNCALKSIDALRVLKEEEKIMDHMLALMTEHGGKLPERPKDEPRESLKPIILEDPRKKITDGAFLPGWNLPTVSIEEAGMIDHKIALEQQKKSQAREAKEKLVKEYGDSDDDETELQKKREWDDWKDDNKKGSGNTGTKGYFY